MSMRTLVMAGTAIAVLAIAGTLAFAPWNAPSIAQTTISQLSVAPPADVVRGVPPVMVRPS